MSGFEFLGDNFGREFPKPFGVGLESYTQERAIGDDLLIVRDPKRDGAWFIAEHDSLVEARP